MQSTLHIDTQLDKIISAIDDAIIAAAAKLEPAYHRNAFYSFWHDVGLTALGAVATVLVGAESLFPKFETYFKIVILMLTAGVTMFAACNQFFKFKSRADACHAALRTVSDIKDEFALICADSVQRSKFTDESANVLRRRLQNAIKGADLLVEQPSIWRILGQKQARSAQDSPVVR